jgi:archaellin
MDTTIVFVAGIVVVGIVAIVALNADIRFRRKNKRDENNTELEIKKQDDHD